MNVDSSSLFDNELFLPVVVAISVILLTFIILLLRSRGSSARKYFIILGTSNAGKTTLLSLLAFKKVPLTYTSIKDNKLVAKISKPAEDDDSTAATAADLSKKKTVELIDVPGSDKIRYKFFNLHKKFAKALIFVIDSSTYIKDTKDVAQYLFEILTDESLCKSNLKLLIVCNKQDHENSKSKSVIQSSLEKEIDLLRKISSSALKSTNEKGSSDTKRHLLTSSLDKPFEFKNLRSFKVEFVEANCVNENEAAGGDSSGKLKPGQISNVVNWIYTNA